MSTIGVALVGGGFAARALWAPRLKASPGVELRALADPSADTRAGWRDELGESALFASHTDISTDGLDLAFILTPNTVHVEQARWFMERGVTCVVEKPVCLSLAEVDELAAAETGDVACIPTRVNVHRADIKRLLEMVRAGRCGAVRHVEASWIRANGLPATSGWRTQSVHSGGGVLLDLGWHLADVVFELLGSEWPSKAAASFSADFLAAGGQADWITQGGEATVGASAGGGEDTVRGMFVTENGVSVGLTAAWASHQPLDETCITVVGVDGEVSLRTTFGLSPHRAGGSTLTLRAAGKDPVTETFESPIGDEYDRFVESVLDRVRSNAVAGSADLAVTRRVVQSMILLRDAAI